MSATKNYDLTRNLFPAWSPSDDEARIFVTGYGQHDPDDVYAAIQSHKLESPSSFPNLAVIVAKARAISGDRAHTMKPAHDPNEAHALESTSQWIERTVASATPEELAELERRVPMAMHMPGLIAAGIEKFRRGRRATAR